MIIVCMDGIEVSTVLTKFEALGICDTEDAELGTSKRLEACDLGTVSTLLRSQGQIRGIHTNKEAFRVVIFWVI